MRRGGRRGARLAGGAGSGAVVAATMLGVVAVCVTGVGVLGGLGGGGGGGDSAGFQSGRWARPYTAGAGALESESERPDYVGAGYTMVGRCRLTLSTPR